MYLLTVIPLERKAQAGSLSYFSKEKVLPGTLVVAPFRTGEITGLVSEVKDVESEKSNLKNASFVARKIKKVIGDSFLLKSFIKSAEALASYHSVTSSEVLTTFIPKHFLTLAKKIKKESLTEETESDGVKAIPEVLALRSSLSDRIDFYKINIRELFAQKKSLLIIAPTVQMVELLKENLSKGVADYVVALSGELTSQKSDKEMLRALRTDHSVVIICTPQFIALPRNDYGKIIMESEGSTSYRGILPPFLDAKIFIELYARHAHIPLVFADSILSVDTYEKIVSGKITELKNPAIPLVSTKKETIIARNPETKSKRVFTMVLKDLEDEISKAENIHTFLFTLRNGIATQTVCKDCGETVSCEECGIPLVLYETKDGRVFICNACKAHTPSLATCTNCKSWNLTPIGIGIDGVYKEVSTKFPNRKIFRIDKSVVSTIKQGREIFNSYIKTPGAILIGTELAISYLKENPVELVGIVSFDSLFHIPSYRVGERTLRLLNDIREISKEKLYIQSSQENHPILKITDKHSLSLWYEQELAERKQFNYPPFTTIIKIITRGTTEELKKSIEKFKQDFEIYKPDVFAGWENKKRSIDRVTTLLRVKHQFWSQNTQDSNLKSLIKVAQEESEVIVNPENLL